MQVFIMRHGEAALEAASDAQRPLTQAGHAESVRMAAWLASQAGKIDRVLVSPYLRAQQTLAAVREVLPLPGEAETLDDLVPGGDANVTASYLEVLSQQASQRVLVISHLPLVGYLVSALCPQEMPPMFSTSAIAAVTLDGATGELEWQVSPSQLADGL
ncbi:phosphohistidine phosphatase SixA [Edwardsiella ictaluri]|uniref:Phosphohistidine phosphatase SixA, putative n=2 Tax=Edwardsiella ictaluri TaxID=67780 RepID=C5BAF5_EDWI9|nr:phosphohistidine phosphatase SixA [Edwardsiella ictaluri]ACR69925.1 phosphohistidine phosphatase SixA, putative [Edwardsiella ictaluri 93-146]ARD38961.1 phosphohistidine phosphatase SixA [Edwardsiella ictaluri]AVZ83143.1 phosphohistidine phosphatase SixA [Edwardsiella ictaluri]EKS7764234.1 phosphohistidine phosphatase SixA [Edwardsiella ictaluri]EKS7771093.1 phosphohistidine phosphatase SixA [Edwardsiella ictaluri]